MIHPDISVKTSSAEPAFVIRHSYRNASAGKIRAADHEG
jgi:hypothetical protein